MKKRFPSQTTLDPDEIHRLNRVRIAHYLAITPAQVDAMPASDVDDVIAVLMVDAEK